MATTLRFVVPFGLALITFACGGKADGGNDPPSEPAAASQAPGSDTTSPALTTPAFCASDLGVDDASVARRIFDGLTPSPASDYLALRRFEISVPSPRDNDPGLVTLTERGTVCASAGDRTGCTKAYGRLKVDAPWSPFVFFTRGDQVGIVRTQTDAMSLLGTVDSPEEAYFVAGQAGFRSTCRGPNATGYRVVGDGFELVSEAGGCGKPVERVTVRVHADGTTEEISRVTTEPTTSPCPQP